MLQGVDDTTDPRTAPDRSGPVGAAAKRATASTSKAFESMDSRAVPVAPDHPDPVGPDERDGHRPHVGRNPARIQKRPTAHLLHAFGARTRQPESARLVEVGVAAVIPLDQQAFVEAGYRMGNRNS